MRMATRRGGRATEAAQKVAARARAAQCSPRRHSSLRPWGMLGVACDTHTLLDHLSAECLRLTASAVATCNLTSLSQLSTSQAHQHQLEIGLTSHHGSTHASGKGNDTFYLLSLCSSLPLQEARHACGQHRGRGPCAAATTTCLSHKTTYLVSMLFQNQLYLFDAPTAYVWDLPTDIGGLKMRSC